MDKEVLNRVLNRVEETQVFHSLCPGESPLLLGSIQGLDRCSSLRTMEQVKEPTRWVHLITEGKKRQNL